MIEPEVAAELLQRDGTLAGALRMAIEQSGRARRAQRVRLRNGEGVPLNAAERSTEADSPRVSDGGGESDLDGARYPSQRRLVSAERPYRTVPRRSPYRRIRRSIALIAIMSAAVVALTGFMCSAMGLGDPVHSSVVGSWVGPLVGAVIMLVWATDALRRADDVGSRSQEHTLVVAAAIGVILSHGIAAIWIMSAFGSSQLLDVIAHWPSLSSGAAEFGSIQRLPHGPTDGRMLGVTVLWLIALASWAATARRGNDEPEQV
jgi:hypothetical protein